MIWGAKVGKTGDSSKILVSWYKMGIGMQDKRHKIKGLEHAVEQLPNGFLAAC